MYNEASKHTLWEKKALPMLKAIRILKVGSKVDCTRVRFSMHGHYLSEIFQGTEMLDGKDYFMLVIDEKQREACHLNLDKQA